MSEPDPTDEDAARLIALARTAFEDFGRLTKGLGIGERCFIASALAAFLRAACAAFDRGDLFDSFVKEESPNIQFLDSKGNVSIPAEINRKKTWKQSP